MDSILEIAKNL